MVRPVEGAPGPRLHPDIVVKVLNKKVGEGKYYKQKGVRVWCVRRRCE